MGWIFGRKKGPLDAGPGFMDGRGGGGAIGPEQQAEMLQSLQGMEQQLGISIDSHKKLLASCFKLCIPNTYHDSELNTGESVCVDRCVSKYLKAMERIMNKFQESERQQMEYLQKQIEQGKEQVAE